MNTLANTNVFNTRYATFSDIGTMCINDGTEKFIAKLNYSIESVILVFRAYGNYKAWCKIEGLNVDYNTFKAFYDLVLKADWKIESDHNVATAKNLLEHHKQFPIYYTKMQRIQTN